MENYFIMQPNSVHTSNVYVTSKIFKNHFQASILILKVSSVHVGTFVTVWIHQDWFLSLISSLDPEHMTLEILW